VNAVTGLQENTSVI